MQIGLLLWSAFVIILWSDFHKVKFLNIFLLLTSILLAFGGISIYSENIPYRSYSNIAGVLFSPILFLTIHFIMRKIYYSLYGFEPSSNIYMTNNATNSNRKLNISDHLVILVPTLLSFYLGTVLCQ